MMITTVASEWLGEVRCHPSPMMSPRVHAKGCFYSVDAALSGDHSAMFRAGCLKDPDDLWDFAITQSYASSTLDFQPGSRTKSGPERRRTCPPTYLRGPRWCRTNTAFPAVKNRSRTVSSWFRTARSWAPCTCRRTSGRMRDSVVRIVRPNRSSEGERPIVNWLIVRYCCKNRWTSSSRSSFVDEVCSECEVPDVARSLEFIWFSFETERRLKALILSHPNIDSVSHDANNTMRSCLNCPLIDKSTFSMPSIGIMDFATSRSVGPRRSNGLPWRVHQSELSREYDDPVSSCSLIWS